MLTSWLPLPCILMPWGVLQPSSSVGFGPILATSSRPCDAPLSLCLDHGAVLR